MLNNSQRIDAIVWKAKNEKTSYGAFSSRLTERQKDRIYEEYEVHWNNKMEAERKRLDYGIFDQQCGDGEEKRTVTYSKNG